MTRVALFGDPTKALGTVAVPECALVVAALDLAEERGLPVEWFALSSGAKISMDSGTENMDAVARALRRIIAFTQAGGEINVVVAGINVGAQPYWNAEATMLMHTKGILVMTPDSAMVLTGKHSLDYSGGVSAEDNFGLGGYDRVMGPNGQAQYWAPNLSAAVACCSSTTTTPTSPRASAGPGRPRPTTRGDRDVRAFPHSHPSSEFTTVGDVFSPTANPDRKKPFDIRTVMRAVADQDHAVLERWAGMADADTTVVLDAHLGGHPVTVLGVESRPIPRRGSFPTDGPDQWTAGTLFPPLVEEGGAGDQRGQRQPAAGGAGQPVGVRRLTGVAAERAAGVRRRDRPGDRQLRRADRLLRDLPVPRRRLRRVLRRAERQHGGAGRRGLLRLGARRGARGRGRVHRRGQQAHRRATPGSRELEAALSAAEGVDQAHLRVELAAAAQQRCARRSWARWPPSSRAIHNIERARDVGSVHAIVPAAELRPRLIDAVERGMDRAAGL